MRRTCYGIVLVLAVGIAASFTSTVTAQSTDPNAYYDALTKRSDYWKSWSLRDQAQLESLKSARSLPADVNYIYPNDPDPRKQDAAKMVIPATVNSLPNYVVMPFQSEEGHTYLTTWDAWFGCESLASRSGLQNWKTFQWTYPRTSGGKDAIWMEVQTRFDEATSSSSVGRVRMRQYSSTAYDPVPTNADFQVKCETWTRYWALLEVPPYGSGDVMYTLWVADSGRDAVKIHDRFPWRRDAPGRIENFWLEYNTSTDYVNPTRGPITNYVRNVVVLRDVTNPTALLQRPNSSNLPPSTSGAPAPPTNVRIIR